MGRFRPIGSSAAILAELRDIRTANQLDWQSPLSAEGYARWGNSLLAKHDTVAVVKKDSPDGVALADERMSLTTTAGEESADTSSPADRQGTLITQAELVVRTAEWHPVEERLWVAGREYEVAELDYKVFPRSKVEAGVFTEPAARVQPVQARRSRLTEAPATQPPARPDPDETEMAVRYELHQLDADLGERVDIRQESSGEIHIDASETSSRLQSLLKEKLSSLPGTELQHEKAPPEGCATCFGLTSAAEEKHSPALTFPSAANPNEKRLEEIFGEPRAQESFTREVLNLSGEALSDCFASESGSALSSASRGRAYSRGS